jgi:quercetin 2,3-dioxygenase
MEQQIISSFSPLVSGRWQTLDPFLFCVYHNDHYPAGKNDGAPKASLAGRTIGSDFSDKDGWSMYHGSVAPGFPRHPHRGFETITIAREGYIDHSDSMGATARFGQGDVQWMTAGAGVVHAEMFPLVHQEQPNPTELFQIWLNLPKSHKMVKPYFTMFWHEQIPKHVHKNTAGAQAELAVIAGTFHDMLPLPPPPNSWASQAQSNVAIWTIKLQAYAEIDLPAVPSGSHRVIYFFKGKDLFLSTIDDSTSTQHSGNERLLVDHIALSTYPHKIRLHNVDQEAELLILQGSPLKEPVVQHGPFVMNTKEEIRQAINDYQKTQFGGWPWQKNDPTHTRVAQRFAIHANGKKEQPT